MVRTPKMSDRFSEKFYAFGSSGVWGELGAVGVSVLDKQTAASAAIRMKVDIFGF
jgi:hypothetical protein